MSDQKRRFPILQADRLRDTFGTSVPWEVVEIGRREALRFHSQTLEVLASRGGLSWAELGNILAKGLEAELARAPSGSREDR